MFIHLVLVITMTTAIFRIIGNDLPPRHSNFQTLKNVQQILTFETDSYKKHFILNRIINETVGNIIKGWIINKNHTFYEIKFIKANYMKIHHDYRFHIPDIMYQSREHSLLYQLRIMDHVYRYKNIYVMNNNGGRNTALKIGKKIADIVMPLDGNIFMQDHTIASIHNNIQKNHADYYLLTMQRQGQSGSIWKEEPQLVFTNNSTMVFNEKMRYGRRSKLELLWRLNVRRPDAISTFPFEESIKEPIHSNIYHVGHVHRLSSGKEEAESSRYVRNLLRLISIQERIDKLDITSIVFKDYSCKLKHYMTIRQYDYNCHEIKKKLKYSDDAAILQRYKEDFSPYLLDIAPNYFRALKPLLVCNCLIFYSSIVHLDTFDELVNNSFILKRFNNTKNLLLINSLSDYHFGTLYQLSSKHLNSMKLIYSLLRSYTLLENKRAFIRVVNAIPFRLIGQDCRHYSQLLKVLPYLSIRHPEVSKYVVKCK